MTAEYLQGYLDSQAQVRTVIEDTDEVYTFTIEEIDGPVTGVERLLGHFDLPSDHNWSVSLAKSNVEALRSALAEWFIHSHKSIIDHTMDTLEERLGSGYAVEAVAIGPSHGRDLNPTYEVQWQDFLLTGPRGAYLLHFGVSD